MFDAVHPPTTYKQFRRQVLESVEEREVISEDEHFPPAVFTVSRNGEGNIDFIADKFQEIDDEKSLLELLAEEVPKMVWKHEAKYVATVLPGSKPDHEEEMIRETVVVAMLGIDTDAIELEPPERDENYIVIMPKSLQRVDLFTAFVNRDEEIAYLDPWDKPDPSSFMKFLTPLKQAISLQDIRPDADEEE